jgi:AcrR family transcriptional regulator
MRVMKKPAGRRGRPRRGPAPEPRRLPRSALGTTTVDAIVTAADRVLVAHGAEGLTTNRIAELAGVSIGSVYQYFPNKEAIVRALQGRYIALFNQIVKEALDAAHDLRDAAGRVVRGLTSHARAPYPYRQLWALRTAAGAHELFAAQHRWMVDEVAAALERFGTTRGAAARTLAFMLVHGLDGIANAAANDPAIDAVAVGAMFLVIVDQLRI